MTDGIAAIQSRVAQLQGQFTQLGPRSGVSGASGQRFAAELTAAQGAQSGGATASPSATAPAATAAGASTTAPARGTATGATTASTAPAQGTAGGPATTGATGAVTSGGGVTATHQPSKVLGGGSRITSTMREAIEEVDAKFGKFSAIGAWRADGGMPGSDHPTGKAADFMITSGGKMPSAARLKEGWEIANYLKDNADRLGVKYVIFAQHIWNPSRAGEGWRLMEDRGGVTANHFDHVHLSVAR
ncbi:hypothetical protein [Planomonospora parontospora]|uniref:hypothetical protein n=1 Tax=Planomonospora parontospora TaxID=58119 RepID=UPI0016711194|nr:hypothetical protein [Planomonospora parontospora]GGL47452.1 hypothetical protein GCM10014719_55990 [Planomonospora parontospora subsp. antibiotica]GII19862.1 hypothetical protein Ppa05_65880 [Planomonospora parontospora subsp. antibiotica]